MRGTEIDKRQMWSTSPRASEGLLQSGCNNLGIGD